MERFARSLIAVLLTTALGAAVVGQQVAQPPAPPRELNPISGCTATRSPTGEWVCSTARHVP
jgi:hypothetical protein